MTSHSDDFANRDLDSLQESPRRNEDMDKVIQELTVAVMKSRNVTSLTRALRSKKVDPKGSQSSELSAIASGSLSKRKHNLRGSYRSTKKISRGSVSGVSLMRDLWKQTGMKTNGRKLLADGHDEDVLTMEEVGVRKTKRPKKKEGERSSRDAVSSMSCFCVKLKITWGWPVQITGPSFGFLNPTQPYRHWT